MPKKSKVVLQRLKDYQDVFGTEKGTRVLHDLATSCNLYSSSFDENPLEMARKEGAREAVLGILKMLEVNIFDLETKYKDLEEMENANA